MTEQDWLSCDNPARMLTFLTDQGGDEDRYNPGVRIPRLVSNRKLRLFACGCCRLVWDRLTDERSRRAVEVAEAFADGTMTREELGVARYAASLVPHDGSRASVLAELSAWGDPLVWSSEFFSRATSNGVPPAVQAALLRCVAGSPSRPTVTHRGLASHGVLDWNGNSVPRVARTIYDTRDWEALPYLADALEEAGCDDQDVLAHCRGLTRCPECFGSRSVTDDHGGNIGVVKWCPGCRGKGWVPAGPPCPRCGGGGLAVGPWEDGVMTRLDSCGDCSGTGRLPAVHGRGCWVMDLVLGKE